MDASELLEEWERNKGRPAYVRERRDVIHDHTDTSDPIPDGSLSEVREWLSSYKSTVTKQLREGAEGGETPTESDSETEDKDD